jgi:hypothetical protein
MLKIVFPSLLVAALLCGCDKQTQVKTEKIDVLTQKMFILQQSQAKQLEAIQSQLAALQARLDKSSKAESDYFLQSQDRALFYHTNTLYFLLTVDKKIQGQFDLAAAAREDAKTRALFYHTNLLDTVYFCTSQVADGMAAQEKRIEDNLNAQSTLMFKSLGEQLADQAKTAEANQAEAVKRIESLETRLAQIQRDLDQLKTHLVNLSKPVPSSQ